MLLYGAGGHAKVVVDCLDSQEVEIEAIFDDATELVSLNGFDVIGEYDSSYCPDDQIIISVGDNTKREKLVNKVSHRFGKAIHSSCVVSPYARVGEGSVIIHGSVVQTGAKIGKHVIVNTMSSVDHDVSIGDFAHISPKVTLCESVHIGEGVHIGAGATVLPNIKVGKWCVIGAGAVITQNLPDYSLVVGVPGKVIRKLDR